MKPIDIDYEKIIRKCPNQELARERADAIKRTIKALSSKADSNLAKHLTACLERLKALEEYANPEWRLKTFGEIEGEVLAAKHMRETCKGLKMQLGFEYPGYTGIDQIWAGSAPRNCSGLTCNDPIVVVEAKATTADLNPRQLTQRPPKAYQMDRNWIRHHADKITENEEEKTYQKLGECLKRGVETGCPTVLGVVIAGGRPHETEDYPTKNDFIVKGLVPDLKGCKDAFAAIEYY